MFPTTHIFPVVIIALSIGAAVVYGFNRMPVHAVYWMAAATLNVSVLFMGE